MPETAMLVLEERHGAVVLLTLNRPERHHALSVALATALADAVQRAEADDRVHALVLTGSGDRAFCAGADMVESSGADGAPPRPGGAGPALARVAATPLPIIAAVNGYCYGGGAALAIHCDIRLASERATFRLPGAEYGLVVAAATLPRLVGAAKAKELIFTARRLDATEALACGLVNAVYPHDQLLASALAMAAQIAANSPVAVQASKRVIDAATLDSDARTLENDLNRQLRQGADHASRFRAATTRVTGRSRG